MGAGDLVASARDVAALLANINTGLLKDWMTAEDWEAWCDATAVLDDEPPGLGWDDEDQDPELAPGKRVAWAAGFAAGGDADAVAGGSALASRRRKPGSGGRTRRRTPGWSGGPRTAGTRR